MPPNPSLHPKCYSGLRPPARSGELKRSVAFRSMRLNKAREILLEHLPDANLRPQTHDEWHGPFALPGAVLAYYGEVGPIDLEIETYGNPWYIPKLAELWRLQAGYRYHPETNKRFEDWSDDWLVVAYEGGDPYIFDVRTETILYDYHGRGVWEPKPIFKNLAEMIFVFAVLGGIGMRARPDLTDEDGYILAANYAAAQVSLERILTEKGAALAILSTLGWEQQPNSPHAP